MAEPRVDSYHRFNVLDFKAVQEHKKSEFTHSDGRKLTVKKVNNQVSVKVERSFFSFMRSKPKTPDAELAQDYKLQWLMQDVTTPAEIIESVSNSDELARVLKGASKSTVLGVTLRLQKSNPIHKFEISSSKGPLFVEPELGSVINKEFLIELAQERCDIVIHLLEQTDFNHGQFDLFEILFQAFDEAIDKGEFARNLPLKDLTSKGRFIDFLRKKSRTEPEKVLRCLPSISSLDVDQEVMEIYLNSLQSLALSQGDGCIDISLAEEHGLKLDGNRKHEYVKALNRFPIAAKQLISSGVFDKRVHFSSEEIKDINARGVVQSLLDNFEHQAIDTKDIQSLLNYIPSELHEPAKMHVFKLLAVSPNCDFQKMNRICNFLFPEMRGDSHFILEPVPFSLDQIMGIKEASPQKASLVCQLCGFAPDSIESQPLKDLSKADFVSEPPEIEKYESELAEGLKLCLERALRPDAKPEQLIVFLQRLKKNELEFVISSYKNSDLGRKLQTSLNTKLFTDNEVLLLKFFALQNLNSFSDLLKNVPLDIKVSLFSHPNWHEDNFRVVADSILQHKGVTFIDDLTSNYILTMKPDEIGKMLECLAQKDTGKDIVKQFVKWLPEKLLKPELFGLEGKLPQSGESYFKEVFSMLPKAQKVEVMIKVMDLIKKEELGKNVTVLLETSDLTEALLDESIQKQTKLDKDHGLISNFFDMLEGAKEKPKLVQEDFVYV
ncbi:hypothetical protein JQC92_11315 [Shewanella sp. 202IG2-18]|uniref:hypothetical protein n=1 Tax=Parashewanella hymeniacidonis TaxID=2807618 RepID=UPI00195F6DA6|nr:hypothetical protein [Parashewanella hymeniacidonis]MBM7072609.1 hypothetical protein [Parashewanella hymeniacidonis]